MSSRSESMENVSPEYQQQLSDLAESLCKPERFLFDPKERFAILSDRFDSLPRIEKGYDSSYGGMVSTIEMSLPVDSEGLERKLRFVKTFFDAGIEGYKDGDLAMITVEDVTEDTHPRVPVAQAHILGRDLRESVDQIEDLMSEAEQGEVVLRFDPDNRVKRPRTAARIGETATEQLGQQEEL